MNSIQNIIPENWKQTTDNVYYLAAIEFLPPGLETDIGFKIASKTPIARCDMPLATKDFGECQIRLYPEENAIMIPNHIVKQLIEFHDKLFSLIFVSRYQLEPCVQTPISKHHFLIIPVIWREGRYQWHLELIHADFIQKTNLTRQDLQTFGTECLLASVQPSGCAFYYLTSVLGLESNAPVWLGFSKPRKYPVVINHDMSWRHTYSDYQPMSAFDKLGINASYMYQAQYLPYILQRLQAMDLAQDFMSKIACNFQVDLEAVANAVMTSPQHYFQTMGNVIWSYMIAQHVFYVDPKASHSTLWQAYERLHSDHNNLEKAVSQPCDRLGGACLAQYLLPTDKIWNLSILVPVIKPVEIQHGISFLKTLLGIYYQAGGISGVKSLMTFLPIMFLIRDTPHTTLPYHTTILPEILPVQNIINYQFQNPGLMCAALDTQYNDALSFLGDHIINIVLTDYYYENHITFMDCASFRAMYNQINNYSIIAMQQNLHLYIHRDGHTISTDSVKIPPDHSYGCMLKALVAAMSLDGNLSAAADYVVKKIIIKN